MASRIQIDEVIAEIDDQPAAARQETQPPQPPETELDPAILRRQIRRIERRMARLQAEY